MKQRELECHDKAIYPAPARKRHFKRVVCYGLFGAAILLLQGVAQLEGEALARVPETAAAVRGRLIIVGLFFAAAFCPGALFVTFAGFFPPPGFCSPTAESRRTTTRPAPLTCALTGDLDTRPA